MSPTLIVASVIVMVSCIGFIVVGSIYKWDITSPGYGRWTRVVGVVAVLALAGVTAWARIDEPLIAAAVILGGIVLAIGFSVVHKRVSAKVR